MDVLLAGSKIRASQFPSVRDVADTALCAVADRISEAYITPPPADNRLRFDYIYGGSRVAMFVEVMSFGGAHGATIAVVSGYGEPVVQAIGLLGMTIASRYEVSPRIERDELIIEFSARHSVRPLFAPDVVPAIGDALEVIAEIKLGHLFDDVLRQFTVGADSRCEVRDNIGYTDPVHGSVVLEMSMAPTMQRTDDGRKAVEVALHIVAGEMVHADEKIIDLDAFVESRRLVPYPGRVRSESGYRHFLMPVE
jgi:hypothetical protein